MATAFIIMFREGFEAALIVAILYAYVIRIERRDLSRSMWGGVITALVLSAGAAVAIHATIANLSGPPRLRAFAIVSFAAVIVLTWMVLWMRRHAHKIRGELHGSIDAAVSQHGNISWAVALAAFFAVLREGLEAALFLLAVDVSTDGGGVLAGGLVGLAIAGALGWLVVLGGLRIPMRQFFQVTGVLLIVFAAGLLARTVLFLQVAGDLGSMWNNVYDLSGHAWLTGSTESGRFLGALFGWDPRPSIEQIIVWVTYLVVTLLVFFRPVPARLRVAAPSARAPSSSSSSPGSPPPAQTG